MMASKKTELGHMKFAEKLVILNDRSQGILTRIYNVKKACAVQESKPRYLKEEAVRSAITHLLKKFPQTDVKRNSSTYGPIDQHKHDILKNLSLYYHTFVELLDLKEHIISLLTQMDVNQCQLDITLNYDLTAGFLNLLSNFVALMIMLGRVDDRKAILALYNAAYDLLNGRSEPSFPRLGQMILDYENPLRKLSEDFSSMNRMVSSALSSLQPIYFHRNISAADLRNAGMISLISNPQQMLHAALTENVACDYLSLEAMDRWIIFGITVCHAQLLTDPKMDLMLKKSMENSWSLRLFRDEPLLVYTMLRGFFDSYNGYGKRVKELKQMEVNVIQNCAIFHAHRRQFVRTALRELCMLIKDQPLLLGPKILFVWMGLSLARDEVLWLLRHMDLVNVNKKLRVSLENIIVDRSLPELLFYMCELRSLVCRHADLIAAYHRDFIASYDAIALRQVLEEKPGSLDGLADNEQLLIRTFVDAVARVKTHKVEFGGLRLDWYRFQANVSVSRSGYQLRDHRIFATMMNTTVFHTKMIDLLDEMLKETSDLSIYCYYPEQFNQHVEAALKIPQQARYTIAFAQLAEHFAHSTHDMCPEEKEHIIERGSISCNSVLEKISLYASRAFEDFAREEHKLADATTPRACVEMIYVNYQGNEQSESKRQQQQKEPLPLPGYESARLGIKAGELSELERRCTYFSEILQAIAHVKQIQVSNDIFTPKEFLYARLEVSIMKCLVQFALPVPEKSTIPRRPTEVYQYMQCILTNIQRVDDCVGIDLARLFNDALSQQTQLKDSNDTLTLTSIYCDFYCEMLRRANLGQFLYSEHLKSFISNPDSDAPADFPSSELYTDTRELRALAQLISPAGIKILAERLISMVAGQIFKLMEIVSQEQTCTVLREARKSYDKPAKMRELVAILSGDTPGSSGTSNGSTAGRKVQSSTHPNQQNGAGTSSPTSSILHRVIIIGGIVAFRNLLYEAVNDVLKARMPFLMNALSDLHESVDDGIKMSLSEVCAATGQRTDIDQGLINILRMKWGFPPEKPPITPTVEKHYDLCCLIMVFVAIALPQLANTKQSAFKASTIASQNNCHSLSLAINLIAGVLFYIHGRDDVADRMREFLALSSSSLLQVVNSTSDPEAAPLHQSMYILLEHVVRESPWLNYTPLESCLPYPLIRTAYLQCYRAEAQNPLGQNGAGSAR